MSHHEVEKFKVRSRWLHWIVVASAFTLAITGLFLYVPQWGIVAQDGWTRLIHRIASVLFIAAPALYILATPRGSLSFLKTTLSWGKDDVEWLKVAPDYYFGGDEDKMPPQPEMNSGQKLFALAAIACTLGFIITGAIMWFAKGSVPASVFQWSVFVHDVCFIVGGSFTLLHLYLGAIHPRMTESLRSMITGKVSVEYAKSHHGKWYNEVAEKEGGEETPGDQGEG